MTAGLTIFIPSAPRKRVTQRFQAIGGAIVRNDEVVGSIPTRSTNLLRGSLAETAYSLLMAAAVAFSLSVVANGCYALPGSFPF
jgi:hypothetical protein